MRSTRFLTPARLFLSITLLAGTAALALAQFGGAGVPQPRPRQEYLHQEVQVDAIVKTLNDLDGEGWDVFQVVPVWGFQGEGQGATLQPKSYQVFGRRPLRAQPNNPK